MTQAKEAKITVITSHEVDTLPSVNVDQPIVVKGLSKQDYEKAIGYNDRQTISFYEDEHYAFVGPLVENERQDCCFFCFREALKSNQSLWFERVERMVNRPAQKGSGLASFYDDFIRQHVDRLKNTVFIIDKYTLSVTEKRVFKSITCPCCKREQEQENWAAVLDKSYLFSGSYRRKGIDEIVTENADVMDKIIDKDTGIGTWLMRDVDSKIIPMFYTRSFLADREYFSYGRTFDTKHAKISGIFEMIERYSTMVPHFSGELYGSYDELSEQGWGLVHPDVFQLADEEQRAEPGYAFNLYDDEKNYYWKKVYELNTEKAYYLPEQIVCFDNGIVRDEERYIYETSNGCALGTSLEEATMYALFELIERDNFLVHWYNRLAPVELDISDLENDLIKNVIHYMEQKGYRIHVFDITMETGIPAIWGMIVDEQGVGKVKVYNAAGAHINPEKALEAALVEIITSVFVYNKILAKPDMQEKLEELKGNPDGVRDMESHVYFYSLEENFKYLDFAFENKQKVAFKEVFSSWYHKGENAHTFADILEKVKVHHPTIYLANLNSHLTREMNIWSVKAIVPTMLTMTFGHQHRRMNMERILNGPVVAGKREKRISCTEVNLIPHPFP